MESCIDHTQVPSVPPRTHARSSTHLIGGVRLELCIISAAQNLLSAPFVSVLTCTRTSSVYKNFVMDFDGYGNA